MQLRGKPMTFWSCSAGRRALEIVLLALVYWGVGKAALLLAIPPGYVTAVWPGAGIALAWILVRGNGVWPGIFLGSLCLNLHVSTEAVLAGPLLKPLLLGLAVGVGASLQGLVGAMLVRHYVGYPTSLTNEQQIVALLLLGGPLSCLINSTVGVAAMYYGGAIPLSNVPFSWWTWWIGDTMGAVIFAPLILLWSHLSPGTRPKRQLYVTAPLMLAMALSVWFFIRASSLEKDRIRYQFERLTDHMSQVLTVDFQAYLEVLYFVASFFDGSRSVERGEFHAFVARSLARHPGIHALEWIPLVTHAERQAYEEAAREDGFPDFAIRERQAQHLMVEAAQRDRYFPVYYIEPHEGNEAALGFDIASDQARLEALNRSGGTGLAVATSRITLVQEKGSQPGFLVFVPVYRPGTARDTAESRWRNLLGFTLGAFRIDDMMGVSLGSHEAGWVDIRLYDCAETEGEQFLYSSFFTRGDARGQELPLPYRFSSCQACTEAAGSSESLLVPPVCLPLDMAGRQWMLAFAPTSQYLANNRTWQAWSVLVWGLLGTGFLGAFLLVVTGRTARIEEVVAIRTEELQRINEELQEQITERELVEDALERARERLEIRVKERTRELEEAHKELINRAIEAGRAQLSIMVLHNIGNAITPVQVCLEDARIREFEHIARYLDRAFSELLDHRHDLGDFVNRDVRGKEVFSFLESLVRSLSEAAVRWKTTMGKLAGAVNYISDVLSLQQGYAATEQEDREVVSLNGLIEDAIRMQEGALMKRRIEIRRELAPESPRLTINRNRLMQVVVNVIKNGYEAIDEVPEEGARNCITFKTEQRDGRVELVIADSGIGIPQELSQSVFDLGKSEKGSSGFGLYYCKKFVEANGGEISIAPVGGERGTEVHIVFPDGPARGGVAHRK